MRQVATENHYKHSVFSTMLAVVLGLVLVMSSPRGYGLTPSDDLLVEVSWLSKNTANADVKVFDLREPAAYALGHVPGAVNLPVSLLFAAPPQHDRVAAVPVIRRVFGEHGVDKRRVAVLYDDGSLIAAAPGFWIFELFGHDHVVVLDGGLSAWQKSGLPLAHDVVIAQPSDFEPTVRPARLATKFSTRLAISNPRVDIIDARSNDNYRRSAINGKTAYIPSAVHVPSDDLFQTVEGVSYLKTKGELKALFSSFDPSNKVITYCTVGNKSAITYFNLRRLGYDAANYDGSWREWGADPTLPVSWHEGTPARP